MKRWLVVVWTMALAATAEAVTLQDVQLATRDGAVQATLVFDAPAKFRLYRLDAPPRVIVMASGAGLAADLPADLGGVAFVRAVHVKHTEAGVRVELGLSRRARAEAQPMGNRLVLMLRPEGTAAAAPVNKEQAKPRAVIKDLAVRDLEGATELVIMGDHLDVNHNAFLTPDGKQLILDFWGAKLALAKHHYSFPSQFVSTVDAGERARRVRLVVSVSATAPARYQVSPGRNRFVVRFGHQVARAARHAVTVEAVQFQPEDRIARITIRTDRANPIVNLRRRKDKVVMDVEKARLAPGQERTLDVSSFPGPVRQVDVYQLGDRVRIVARLRERAEVSAFQSGNAATISFVPEDLATARRGGAEEGGRPSPYHGQKVSFNFKDIEIRNALALIAEMSGLNIIMSDDVQGRLTMRLENVPWDQALDLILAAKGLGKEQVGNVLRIAPLAVIRADAEARRKAHESAEDAEPLYTEFIELSYASVNDVKTILEGGSIQQPGTGGGGGQTQQGQKGGQEGEGASAKGGLKLLSKRGSILMDERSNTLIITDTRERLDNIKRLIKWIDRPVRQVLIESRIVEASENFSRELGVRWGGNYQVLTQRNFPYQINVLGAASAGGFAVDLPAAVGQGSGGAIGLQFGSFNGRINLNLELSAAESEGRAKVISTPRVLTSELHEAIIEQNIQIPYAAVTVAGGATTTSTTMQSARLTLRVKPQITADRRIILDLTVNKDTPQANYLVKGGDPIIEKKQVKTRLMVNDGETIVLGGIYSKQVGQTESGVPLLRRIPLIGWLFKSRTVTDKRNELLVFLTPQIVQEARKENLARGGF